MPFHHCIQFKNLLFHLRFKSYQYYNLKIITIAVNCMYRLMYEEHLKESFINFDHYFQFLVFPVEH
jgi:hypothetical protein